MANIFYKFGRQAGLSATACLSPSSAHWRHRYSPVQCIVLVVKRTCTLKENVFRCETVKSTDPKEIPFVFLSLLYGYLTVLLSRYKHLLVSSKELIESQFKNNLIARNVPHVSTIQLFNEHFGVKSSLKGRNLGFKKLNTQDCDVWRQYTKRFLILCFRLSLTQLTRKYYKWY